MRFPPIASLFWRSQRIYQVFGANTDVGKTIFTTLLCKGAKSLWPAKSCAFLKPVSTGLASEADDYTGFHKNHELLAKCRDLAADRAAQGDGWLFLETAGGVHSPTPSGTTQADLYMPLRLPSILIGDARLGGISQTISAFESLRIRGYDVESVLLFEDHQYGNLEYLSNYFRDHHRNVKVAGLVGPPDRKQSQPEDANSMRRYYNDTAESTVLQNVLRHLDRRHEERITTIETMASRAHRSIWWPFTQQSRLKPEGITVIDSAHGDYFQTLRPQNEITQSTTVSCSEEHKSLLQPSFDGSASWWTQGLGHSNPRLTLAAAYAAGRYGHVMFAEAVHQPALDLAETLLRGLGNPRLSRVFFSDDGSTGTEVAVKMALRAARMRYSTGTGEDDPLSTKALGVIGLKGGYHGDTMGAMDCAEPCIYNEKTEWYTGKGFWFDYPTVLCMDGRWQVRVPDELKAQFGQERQFSSLNEIFNLDARESRGEHLVYETFIWTTLQALHQQGRRFGALIIEPIVLGAGGMALVDPLYQRALVSIVRRYNELFDGSASSKSHVKDPTAWSGLPVICDEVFTGLYRLGRFSSSSFLRIDPDISVHAKLLTGGLVPLCTTLASESIFQVFGSNEKTDALLHGHSYTAHPVGCQVALESLTEMSAMEQSGAWDWAKESGWMDSEDIQDPQAGAFGAGAEVWSMWPQDLITNISRQNPRVLGAWALGSVLAVHLRDEMATGYSSNAAVCLRDNLLRGDSNGPWNVHCRVLGNVLYLMSGQNTQRSEIERVASLLETCLRTM
ncbi:hypothetical protein M406DRAFT_114557 [Cryphonectria parasitica EP155]|uniref:Uncharacterized protein n=1 Tax=Cryphonectria parasitica (strain ATCC 38755 / EP155) TaxID=660469 RepID=A0A9P4XT89_CRYP1|nr:uncharacterized protein M406DRAFT_114557 [Cryphonectria parasitica EP155]KAF3760436.1 hypothetical protein M406DRAFT_114557 [Cryphonectria parasitica EP155]